MAMRPTYQMVLVVLVSLFGIADRSEAQLVTIDFSEHGEGAFDPDFFADRGTIFPPDGFVGFIQGDDALVSRGPDNSTTSVTGTFVAGVTSLSALVALSFQGVADFTLSAFDADSRLIESASFRLNQIVEDPGFMGGYVALDLGTLSRPASSFVLADTLVRSAVPPGSAEFGVSTLTYNLVPEPSSLALLGLGFVGVAVFGHRRVARLRRSETSKV